jgi:hypothetical protein
VFQGREDRLTPLSQVQDLLAARKGGTTVLLTTGDHLQSARAAPDRLNTLIAEMIASLTP